MQLQTQLELRTGEDHRFLREWHDSLREAISVLKTTLAEPHLYSARLRTEADQRFQSSSSNSTLSDRTSLMLCDAVVDVLDIENCGRLRDWRNHSPGGRLHLAPSSFWVMITAYHIGDIDLLKRLVFDASFMKQITDSKFGSLTMGLSIAARQGHKEVLLFVMNSYLKDVRYDKLRILSEACISGQAECARVLKFCFPLDTHGNHLSDILRGLRDGPLQPAINYQAFELLMDLCIAVLSNPVAFRASFRQAQGGTDGVLKMLQHRDWGQWKATIVQNTSKTDFRCTSAYMAKIERLILYWIRFPESKAEFETLCRTTAELAVEVNRVDLAEVLYEHIEHDIGSMETQSVIQAGQVNDGIRILEAHGAKNPAVWHRLVCYHHRVSTVGQAALRTALNMLQADNARFLLERQVRLPDSLLPIQVGWRYRRTRDREYEAVVQLLKEYKMRPISVSLEI